ncbi:uncharacterized protein At2g29880 isoform X2 [Eutrema salsugineum]|uniref:uncharacterized protein At2g29880 isoform X2 n=1 Tax=Eutrema salsugineum TaxID=72664 RepID=UPI000CED7A17|nr:uncharacterized protein At2g29880 isoform X2 [Eutrema salsugineum]
MGDSKKKRKEKGDYNPWTPDETKLLIQLLVGRINHNWRDSNGSISKLTIETKLLPDLNKGVCRPKDYKHYQSRMKYLKQQYQSCVDLQRYSSGFGWDPQTKRFTASDEVWDSYFKSKSLAHPKDKNLRYETFEFFDEFQIISGEGVATGKNAIGLGDSTDARTNKEEYVHGIDDLYDLERTTHRHESPEHFVPFDSQKTSDYRREKFQPKKRARSERGTSKKDENSVMGISNQILNLIQQKKERQQREAEKNQNNVWDAIKEILDLEERICYKALTKIYHLGIQDVFVSMSVEERLGWILTNME